MTEWRELRLGWPRCGSRTMLPVKGSGHLRCDRSATTLAVVVRKWLGVARGRTVEARRWTGAVEIFYQRLRAVEQRDACALSVQLIYECLNVPS
jgi:hypothetical protein